MDQILFEWLQIIGRWAHISVGIVWIGTSIFFMWLDRTLKPNPNIKKDGHVGELWMVHGGGFYRVEKLLLGPTKVPSVLHWFKWESYATWMSGMFLLGLIFYTNEGTFLIDSSVAPISFLQGIVIGLFSIFGSWFFYDFVWERKSIAQNPLFGHFLTLAWFVGMTFFLCHTLSGRAAYIHIGAMLGTWMTANVFLRIIPRQIKMVEASKKGEKVNQDWGRNAKNRSTHNTYFTLPVIFIMLSNHFPSTYGHDYNWLVLILITSAGATFREFFMARIPNPKRSYKFASLALVLLVSVIFLSGKEDKTSFETNPQTSIERTPESIKKVSIEGLPKAQIIGEILFQGKIPKRKKLRLPKSCSKQYDGDAYSNEVLVSNGKLKNVLIRVIRGHENFSYPPPLNNAVEIDQRGCLYHPRVTAVRVGRPVAFLNSDPVFHNVKALASKNKRFNINMPRKNQRVEKIFTRPEIFLQTKCSVHPWMGAQIAVLEHPFFDVSDEKGRFIIKDLPLGEYTLEIWHEVFGIQQKEIKVDAKNKPVKIVFKG